MTLQHLEPYKNKTVFVTGALGMVGTNLCQVLSGVAKKIIAIDSQCYTWNNTTNHKTPKVFNKSNIDLHTIDICDTKLMEDFHYSESKIDYIFNLASPASPQLYYKLPEYTLLTGSLGTQNVLHLANAHKATVFHASTSEVYGDPKRHPQKETYYGNTNCFGVRSMYDESKRFSEALCYTHIEEKHTDIRIGRIFNTYGPHMRIDDGRVVTSTIKSALQNKNITIYGDGTQTRSFCYIDDLIKGILILTGLPQTPKLNTPINLGNPQEITVNELVDNVMQLIPSRSSIVYEPLLSDDPLKRKPDISKAKKLLKWEPEVTLQEGLIRTINYLQS